MSAGLVKKISAILLIGILGWTYQMYRPPPPRTCGTPGGPPVTAPRIKLKDGRHLAYKETGVPKEAARHKIVSIHGFDSCRHDALSIPNEIAEELGVYIVSFDRPGYAESDPHPMRTEGTIARDVEELADQLGLGPSFYVVGVSMGGQAVWGCLKYIPHRLAGAALVAPVINYWWPGFPADLAKEAYDRQLMQDQWALRVAHHVPWLTYWWNTQKWFPSSSGVALRPESTNDEGHLQKLKSRELYKAQVRQQGEHESVHRDLMVAFGKWGFDPMDLGTTNPVDGPVHLWQGDQDRHVPISLQHFIVKKLPWIQYHEIAGAGHSFARAEGMAEKIVRSLVAGED